MLEGNLNTHNGLKILVYSLARVIEDLCVFLLYYCLPDIHGDLAYYLPYIGGNSSDKVDLLCSENALQAHPLYDFINKKFLSYGRL